jgi:hypothetical protein
MPGDADYRSDGDVQAHAQRGLRGANLKFVFRKEVSGRALATTVMIADTGHWPDNKPLEN